MAMQVINWPELQPLPADLEALRERLREALPVRSVCQMLVEITLRAYPWTGRADLIPSYHPSNTYQQGQKLALSIPDPQNAQRSGSRAVWLLGQVKQAMFAENPIQGRFQVLTLEFQSRQIQMIGGIPEATYPEPDLSQPSAEDLAWLVQWILSTYAGPLQATLRRLIQMGQIRGRLAGETFLPEPVSAISLELLQPIFGRITMARPWISLETIFRSLPDLSLLERERILELLRARLKESPYRSLGGDRWTTPELFSQIDRDVLRDLPAHVIHSKAPRRMKQGEQELARSTGRFMPKGAREALEELGLGEEDSAPVDSPWRPPGASLQLPALNYLSITQAYIPVRRVMQAFAPELQMAFVQFMYGEHEPFLLDREAGLLKAIHPQAWRASVLEHDLPAGISLWLEYEGNERYRIASRPLPFKRMVPCKLAQLEHGQLHIEHTQISMKYEGKSSLFKARLRSAEIEALFAEASRGERSLREAMIYAMQEICATDPDHRAHWLDLFNTVSLQQMCSPRSLSFLLYTEPCFEPLGEGYFRCKPVPAVVRKPRIRKDRLSQLWVDFLSDPVATRPLENERTAVQVRSRVGSRGPAPFAPEWELPSPLSEPELSVTARSYETAEKDRAGTILVEEEERPEPIPVSDGETEDSIVPADTAEPARNSWTDSLGRLLHSLVELEEADASTLSEDRAASEREAGSELSITEAHEESLSLYTPFRWEPKPAWVNAPAQPASPSPDMVDPRRFVYRPGIPRPLHKRRFYQRYFFYLRRWLNSLFGRAA